MYPLLLLVKTMPNRIIREGILTSTKVCSLGFPEEVFYRRLMSIVDDHGRYEATPQLLRAKLYPLQVDTVRVADITRWMAACQKAGLIALYAYPSVAASPRWISADETAGLSVCDGKPYLVLENFGQQVRAKSKCPPPPGSEEEHLLSPDNTCDHLQSNDSRCTQEKSGARASGHKSSQSSTKSIRKEVLPASDSNCEQLSANAHLDGGVVSPSIHPSIYPPNARAPGDAFPMFPEWEPSPDFWPSAKRAALAPDAPDFGDALSDFVQFFRGHPDKGPRTQAEWEQAFLKNWKQHRAIARSRPQKPNGRAKLSPHSGFAERDYTVGVNPDGSF